MTIKSLRDTLNGLGTDYDDYQVLFCKELHRDGDDRLVAYEDDVFGSMIMDTRNVYIFMSKDAMEVMEKENPNLGKDTVGGWIQGEF